MLPLSSTAVAIVVAQSLLATGEKSAASSKVVPIEDVEFAAAGLVGNRGNMTASTVVAARARRIFFIGISSV
tara:strand:- start:27 stop:242 length:216 start_codon:yes stop_codon:yes gene_type:complete